VCSQSTFISLSEFELSATLPSALYLNCMRLGASWVVLVSAGAATWSAASLFIPWTGVVRPARHSHRNSALVLIFRFIVFQLCAGKRTTWAQSSGSYASPFTHRRCKETGVARPIARAPEKTASSTPRVAFTISLILVMPRLQRPPQVSFLA
jgi:hypothetical protein